MPLRTIRLLHRIAVDWTADTFGLRGRFRAVPPRRRPRPGARAGPAPARCSAPAPRAKGAAVLAGQDRPGRG